MIQITSNFTLGPFVTLFSFFINWPSIVVLFILLVLNEPVFGVIPEDQLPGLLEKPDGIVPVDVEPVNVRGIDQGQLAVEWISQVERALGQEWPNVEHDLFDHNEPVDDDDWEVGNKHVETAKHVQNVEKFKSIVLLLFDILFFRCVIDSLSELINSIFFCGLDNFNTWCLDKVNENHVEDVEEIEYVVANASKETEEAEWLDPLEYPWDFENQRDGNEGLVKQVNRVTD